MKAALHSPIVREAGGILIAAVCLGFVYDAASPLGVRASGRAAARATAVEAVAVALPQTPAAAPEAATPDAGLQNETITAAIYPTGPGPAQAPAGERLPVVMSWAEVQAALARGEIVLVDGRDRHAFEAGHIPGAVSLPLGTIKEQIGEFRAKVPPTQPLVIYCASIRCSVAHKAAVMLSGEYGYADVREMPGGYAEWTLAQSRETAAAGGRP